MAKTVSKTPKEEELSFSFGFASFALLMVLLIPVAYTVVINFGRETVIPEIKPTPKEVQQPIVMGTSGLEAAIQLATDSPGYQSFLQLGLEYYNLGNYQESIEAWNKALTYNQRSELLYTNIGAAYGALKMWDEEIAACEKALTINPHFDLAKRNLNWAKQMKDKK
jgi:tetratricopeptide (TPR) repeat protein